MRTNLQHGQVLTRSWSFGRQATGSHVCPHGTCRGAFQPQPGGLEHRSPVVSVFRETRSFASHLELNVVTGTTDKELRRIYLQNQLPCDIFAIVFVTGLVLLVPV